MTTQECALEIWMELEPRNAVVVREPLPIAQRLEHDLFWALPWVAAA